MCEDTFSGLGGDVVYRNRGRTDGRRRRTKIDHKSYLGAFDSGELTRVVKEPITVNKYHGIKFTSSEVYSNILGKRSSLSQTDDFDKAKS